jgi:hypothetical protein
VRFIAHTHNECSPGAIQRPESRRCPYCQPCSAACGRDDQYLRLNVYAQPPLLCPLKVNLRVPHRPCYVIIYRSARSHIVSEIERPLSLPASLVPGRAEPKDPSSPRSHSHRSRHHPGLLSDKHTHSMMIDVVCLASPTQHKCSLLMEAGLYKVSGRAIYRPLTFQGITYTFEVTSAAFSTNTNRFPFNI